MAWKCFLLFVGRKGGWGFLFLAYAFAVNRRTKKLGKVTKQKQLTRQNWITKNLDASFLSAMFLEIMWTIVNCFFISYANSSVKLKPFRLDLQMFWKSNSQKFVVNTLVNIKAHLKDIYSNGTGCAGGLLESQWSHAGRCQHCFWKQKIRSLKVLSIWYVQKGTFEIWEMNYTPRSL